jgi:hypothetical protein
MTKELMDVAPETIRERIIREVNECPEDTLYEIQNFIKFLDFKIRQNDPNDPAWDTIEHNIPADEYDYELARQADEHLDEEMIPFDTALKESGLTLCRPTKS